MQETINSFRANFQRTKETFDLYLALRAKLTDAVDLSDMLRVVVVLAVSALDRFIHEVVEAGMGEIWAKTRAPTPSFNRFSVPLDAVDALVGGMGSTSWLTSLVRERHGYASFQQPERIQQALSLFTAEDVWQPIGIKLATTSDDVKRRLKLLVDRRNKIAHEADIDPSYPTSRWPIDE